MKTVEGMKKHTTVQPFGTDCLPCNNGDQGVDRIMNAIKHPGRPGKTGGFKKAVGQ